MLTLPMALQLTGAAAIAAAAVVFLADRTLLTLAIAITVPGNALVALGSAIAGNPFLAGFAQFGLFLAGAALWRAARRSR